MTLDRNRVALTDAPELTLEIDGRSIRLTNLDRVLWPETGFTKGDMLGYYRRVSTWLLPHIRGRPMTLRRFPEGVNGLSWFQVQCRGRPEWMRVEEVRGRRGELLRYCLVDDLPALLWAVNLGTLELHPFLWQVPRSDEPSFVVFDLDPGPPVGVLDAARVALALRSELESAGVHAFAKASGSLGIHVYVPLAPAQTWDRTKRFARETAESLMRRDADVVLDRMDRSRRAGKVLVDWMQNDPGASTVAPYSLRAMLWPTVSMPLTWEEIERAVSTGRADALYVGPTGALDRLGRLGDVFAPVLESGQSLPG